MLGHLLNNMKPLVKDETILKMQTVMGNKPITRNFDEKLNICLEEIEELREKQNGTPQVGTCGRLEELTNG